jgi:hypothetical protein
MSASTSFSREIRVFECPSCNQTINTSMQQCPFCSAPVDALAAESAANALSKINQACSDASYLKIMTGLLIPFFFLQLVPFLGLAGLVGFWFLRIAIPVMAIRWFLKYGKIQTTDPDFAPAKRTTLIMGIIGLAVLLLTNYRVFLVR